MTLKEKVGQLNQKLYGWQVYKKNGSKYELTDIFKKHVEEFQGIGALYGLFRADPWSGVHFGNGIPLEDSKQVTNLVQQYLKENTRLGIPALFSEECPHGHQALDSTIFPTHIGSGATWNPVLQRKASQYVAKELSEKGVHLGLVSTLDIARDPRWGRTEECFSEDPYLASKMTEAVVKGMQGGESDTTEVLAVLKHFAAQGSATGGHNAGPALIGERELREIHIPAMKAGIQSGALACMAAYNEIDGIPCHANHFLLTTILREELGFNGVVMADGVALERLLHLTNDKELAAKSALEAGVDLSLWDDIYTQIETAVVNGIISEETLDQAVRRILYVKFLLGLFSNDYKTEDTSFADREEGKELNLAVARESITLLKNRGNILPLNKDKKAISVIGPNADSVYNMLGDYTPPQREGAVVTIKDGIAQTVGKDCDVFYAKGCDIRSTDTSGFEYAKEIARKSDVIIVALGGSSAREFGMAFHNNGAVMNVGKAEMDSGENIDVLDLDLGGVQEELVKELACIGTPIIGVFIQGRPHSISHIEQYLDAILIGWYPGQQGGKAIAEVIFGEVNPSGRLPISIPFHSGQLPVYYNYKDSGGKREYYDGLGEAMYSFGYGLSYSTFHYQFTSVETARITQECLSQAEEVRIPVQVTNQGPYDGNVVMQLYMKDLQSSVTQRIKELKDFRKVWLQAGESKTITLTLQEEDLSIWNLHMKQEVEKGTVLLMIGDSPDRLIEKELIIE
ncbi:glycoside hydrolase family 3 N-terminal domain-containing protein [Gracilibacillus saliphilus]|uniref:glycoside hydrolase family 3 N-terminal domain-containing protein n=1 Tax=Gracilibacillus saliphilus TaxID=543890 RepID=UPI0013D6E4AA|nr:glycoside hydrolase family 3 N-terminal domain-containing protein [Gracilibacillus saliphilus]